MGFRRLGSRGFGELCLENACLACYVGAKGELIKCFLVWQKGHTRTRKTLNGLSN